MKMASMSLVSVFLLSCLAVTSISSQDTKVVAVGDNVTFRLESLTLTPTDSLRWKLNDDLLFYKKPEQIIKGKKEDIEKDGSLKLTNLKKNQTGTYTAEVYDQSGKVKGTQKIKLIILDRVNKPTIKISCNDKTVKFECVSTKAPPVKKYEWLKNNVKLGKEVQGKLEVKLKEAKANTFSCNVSNEASYAISEAVTHKCSGVSGMKISVYDGGKLGIILVLIMTAIVSGFL